MNARKEKDYTIVDLPDDISPVQIDKVEKELMLLIEQESRNFVLNLEYVSHLYSLEISMLVHLYRKIMDVKGQIFIVNTSKHVEDILKSVNLERMIPIFTTLEEFEIEKNLIPANPQEKQEFQTAIIEEEQWVRITFAGSVTDSAAVKKLQQIFSEAKKHKPVLLLDFSHLGIIDSQALEVFVEFAKYVKGNNVRVAILRSNDIIEGLFKILELENIFLFFFSENQAGKFLATGVKPDWDKQINM